MSRVIKFRAWREIQKFMLTPHSIVDLFEYGSMVNPEGVVWMQFTGLKDKNGVEIYEGDVTPYLDCSKSGKVNAEVYFSEYLSQFRVRWVEGSTEYTDDLLQCEDWFEVIGNIHQNPELIK